MDRYKREGRGLVLITFPVHDPAKQISARSRFRSGPIEDLRRRVRAADLSDIDRAGADRMVSITEHYNPAAEWVLSIGCGPRFLRMTATVGLDGALDEADGIH